MPARLYHQLSSRLALLVSFNYNFPIDLSSLKVAPIKYEEQSLDVVSSAARKLQLRHMKIILFVLTSNNQCILSLAHVSVNH